MVADNIVYLLCLGTLAMISMAVAVLLFDRRARNERLQAKDAELIHQKELLRAVINSQEAERQRIGQDLHDDIGSALSALKLVFEIEDPANLGTTHIRIECIRRIETIIIELRHISHNLSPYILKFNGFNAALESLFLFKNHSHVEIRYFNYAEQELLSIPIEVTTSLYRVIEELLNNTLKHACASIITLSCSVYDGMLTISYHDNGCGFNITEISPGIGLRNIESRLAMICGKFELSSSIGEGTLVKIFCCYQSDDNG